MNRDQWIVAANAYSEAHPHQECEGVEAAYHKLVGLRIEPGFTGRVKQLFLQYRDRMTPLQKRRFEKLMGKYNIPMTE